MGLRRPTACAVVAAALLLAACSSSGSKAGRGSTAAVPTRAVRVALPGPVGLLAAGGFLWAVSASTGLVVSFDPVSGARRTKTVVGDSPLRLASDSGTIWVSVFGTGHVVSLDPGTGRIERQVAVGGQPEGIVAAFGSIWVVRQQARELTRISPAGRVLRSYRLGTEPRLVTAGRKYLFASNFTDGTVTRVDPNTGAVRTSARLCDGAQDLVEADGVIWLSCTSGGEVVAVDEASLRVRSRLRLAGEPDGLELAKDALLVVATAGPTLYRVSRDPERPKILSTQRLGPAAPLADRANDDVTITGASAWISSYADGTIFRVTA